MTITYSLAPEPFWYISNLIGQAAGGAKLYTLRSLNHDDPKPVYQDPAGSIPWTNPINFNENGVAPGPFYFQFDSTMPNELYYLRVEDAQGNTLWTIDNFSGGNGGGGGGTSTTIKPLTNYIANNQFTDHIGDTITTSLTNLVIAPSNHRGFTPAGVSTVSTVGGGVVGPDIRFLKNSTVNTDNISFPLFALGDPALAPDVTPVDYVRYQCTSSNPGETLKCFQFPITQKVKNLSNQEMTFKLWAKVNAVPVDIKIYVRQYFGSGTAASSEVRQLIDTITLSATWNASFSHFTVPNVATKSIGTLNSQTDDDALYIQVEMPHNIACDVFFTKPSLYLGAIEPPQDYEDYDQISSITYAARTGDVRVGYLPTAPLGWVAMNDGSIGNVLSGASNFSSASAFQLYSTLYTAIDQAWAPVSTGRTAPGNTMAAAVTDFLANKTLTLPKALGRALASAGGGAELTPRALGEDIGVESHLMTLNELAPHTHTFPVNFGTSNASGGSGRNAASSGASNTGPITGAGAQAALNLMQPTSFMNVYIKL